MRRRAWLFVLASALLAFCKADDFPTTGAEPPYEPDRWNRAAPPAGFAEWDEQRRREWLGTEEGKRWFRSFRIQLRNNCYNYACNRLTDPAPDESPIPFEPGRGGGYTPPNGWCKTGPDGREVPTTADDPGRGLCTKDVTCAVLRAAALADSLKEIDCTEKCPEGKYKKALAIDPLTDAEKADGRDDLLQTDYHWYRQDAGGNWSHKPGEGPATDRAPGDASGAGGGGPITDPREATARRNYTEFCGCFCCGANVRKAERPPVEPWLALFSVAPAFASQPPDTTTVSVAGPAAGRLDVVLLVFAGRANLRWTLTDPNDPATVASMLRGLSPVPPPDWPLLGPRGFLLVAEDPELVARHGLVPIVRVHDGVVEIGEETFADSRGLEAWLRARIPAGFPTPAGP